MSSAPLSRVTRRRLLALIGSTAGSSLMYQAMTSLGLAAESTYKGPLKLDGDPKGASVLILGAGLAGMVAALELRNAGYRVAVLEYDNREGGRCWSLRGGDRYTELGGIEQGCQFSKGLFNKGLYFNPGPWRIPYHHRAVLDYCKRLGVALEPFVQVNHNAYLHGRNAFAGKPQRFREITADFHGHVAELLSKVVGQDKLDRAVSKEDKEILLEALREWGGLDSNYAYRASTPSRRGYLRAPGGGLNSLPEPSQPIALDDILKSQLWRRMGVGSRYEFQTPLFQPVGGMDMIARAFGRQVGRLIRFNAKVIGIRQDGQRVTVTYEDLKARGQPKTATADWCVCTLPLPVLSQIEINVSTAMENAIKAVPYNAAVKIGLQFKRRFWEQDEAIYGGISYTDLPNGMISYPSSGYGDAGEAILLGAYVFGPHAHEFAALAPDERIRKAVEYGTQIHRQYADEFQTGELRRQHYSNLCQIDGRIMLAGEHASYIPGWQEGAILSALDAIGRLHQRVIAGG
jgi:monoamine oxidase